jgi:hypothetical protein
MPRMRRANMRVVQGGADSTWQSWCAVVRVFGSAVLLDIIGGTVLLPPDVARRLAAALLLTAERAEHNERCTD